jgi:hypothetical protein
MRPIRVVVILAVLGLPVLVSAQLPVITVPGSEVNDAANLEQNTISATNLIINTAKWILDLAPLESFEWSDAFFEDLATLQQLASEAQQIGMDLESMQAQIDVLFGLDAAPMTSFEYRQRVADINLRILQVYSYAMRTQTLINTAIRTVDHIMGFVSQVAGLLGKLSIEQTMSQQLGKLHQLPAEANVQLSAFHHAKSTEALAPGVLQQGLRNINEAMMSDHPR